MIDVTVCIPTFPTERRSVYLDQAVASACTQTVEPAEVVVATDRDGDGAGPTRNRTWQQADTGWVAFLDDDDVLYPNHLEVLVAAARTSGADLVWSQCDIIRPDGSPSRQTVPGNISRHWVGGWADLTVLDGYNFIPVTYLIRRDLLDEVGGFPTLGSDRWPHDNCEDWGLLRDVAAAGASAWHVPRVTWGWRWHGRNTSGRPWTDVLNLSASVSP